MLHHCLRCRSPPLTRLFLAKAPHSSHFLNSPPHLPIPASVTTTTSQKKDVSEEKAPARRNSSRIRTQNMRWGRALEYGAGRGTHVRRITSRPAGGGKSGTPPAEGGFLSSAPTCRPPSSSSGANSAAYRKEDKQFTWL